MNLSHKGTGKAGILSAKAGESAETTTFTISFQNAKPPARTYSAEVCAIQYRNDEVFFVFGQRRISDERLDSAISFRMHGFFAKQFLASVRSLGAPGLEEIAEKCGIDRDPLEVISHEPEHLAKLSANVVHLGISGYDTTLDFYQISPMAMMKAKAGKRTDDIDLAPVARVDLRTSLFRGLVAELERLEPSFPEPKFDFDLKKL